MSVVDAAWGFAKTAIIWSPWLIVAGAGGLAYLRHKGAPNHRKHLLMQVAGALGVYVLTLFEYIVEYIFIEVESLNRAYSAAHIICVFMVFVAALVFAAGYTLEKLGKPAPSTFPVV